MRSVPRLVAAYALVTMAGRAPAQRVVGELVDAGGRPVAAALVTLEDSAGTQQGRSLTDAEGRFTLGAAAPGAFVVHAERVGFRATRSGVLHLGAGEIRPVRLVANASAITLEGITARGRPRCRAARRTADALIWDEARKALSAANEASAAGALQYGVVVYRRELDPRTLALWRDRRVSSVAAAATPFGTAAPEVLLQRGFVRVEGDSVAWDAPDAGVLLSREFLDTHCMSAVEHRDSARLVGLRFAPIPGRRAPDIEGTIWLDRRSAELRRLEYRYVNAGWAALHPRVGGRIDFERLPSGHWIVRRWRIRMPMVGPESLFARRTARPGATLELRVGGVAEVGGEVLTVGERALGGAGSGVVVGSAWDSIAGAPLPGAWVHTSEGARIALTDSAGAFRLDGLAPGAHTLSLTHPVLEAAGVRPPSLAVTVPADSPARVVLAGPSPATVGRLHCGRLPADQGVLVGLVRDARGGLERAAVTVTWARPRPASRESITRPDGTYVECGVPLGVPVSVAATHAGRVQRADIVLAQPAAILQLELMDP